MLARSFVDCAGQAGTRLGFGQVSEASVWEPDIHFWKPPSKAELATEPVKVSTKAGQTPIPRSARHHRVPAGGRGNDTSRFLLFLRGCWYRRPLVQGGQGRLGNRRLRLLLLWFLRLAVASLLTLGH